MGGGLSSTGGHVKLKGMARTASGAFHVRKASGGRRYVQQEQLLQISDAMHGDALAFALDDGLAVEARLQDALNSIQELANRHHLRKVLFSRQTTRSSLQHGLLLPVLTKALCFT
jgi:hypothetical protein